MNKINENNNFVSKTQVGRFYFLTQILGVKVFWQGKEIGYLHDVLIVDNGNLAEVTHFLIARPFGRPAFYVPLEKIVSMDAKKIVLDIESVEKYLIQPKTDLILLKDYILDKKVLDMKDREIELVYDAKMTPINNKLYVTDVDLSKYGLLRRMKLKWLADLIYRPKNKVNTELIPWKYVQQLPTNISSFKGEIKLNILKERLHDIDPVDLADIIEEMDSAQRVAVFDKLNTEHASDTLEEIDPNVQRELVASLKRERVAQLINEMTPAQAADVLSVLPGDTADEILDLLDKKETKKIMAIMEKQETKIVDFSTLDFLKFSPDTTVAKVEEEYPKAIIGKDFMEYIYITDEKDKLLGIIDLKSLLLADDNLMLQDFMSKEIISLNPESTLKNAYKTFKRYGLKALPVLDHEHKIVGIVLNRDIMELRHKVL